MSKKILIYLFILSSSLCWNRTALAGMDLIETVLMTAEGVLGKASSVVEKVSTTISNVTSGKIFDKYYQEYMDVKGKIELAQQRFENMKERTNRLLGINKDGNAVNQNEMGRYNEELSNTRSRMAASREALVARGLISENRSQSDRTGNEEGRSDENEDNDNVNDDEEDLSTDVVDEGTATTISDVGAKTSVKVFQEVNTGNKQSSDSSSTVSTFSSLSSSQVSSEKYLSGFENVNTSTINNRRFSDEQEDASSELKKNNLAENAGSVLMEKTDGKE